MSQTQRTKMKDVHVNSIHFIHYFSSTQHSIYIWNAEILQVPKDNQLLFFKE